MRIRTKLTLALLMMSVLVLVAAGLFTEQTIEHSLRARIVDELMTESEQVFFQLRHLPASDGVGYGFLRSYARSGNYRLTIIAGDGRVLFDSDVPEEELGTLENHATRPEFAEALRGGIGTSTRHSITIGRDLLYVARMVGPSVEAPGRFRDAAAIRLSIPLTQVESAVAEMRVNIILASIAVFAIVLAVTGFLARRLSGPIAEMAEAAAHIRSGGFDRRIDVRTNDELGRLGETLNGMIDRLNEDIVRLKKLERVRTEFLGNVSHELRTPIFAIQGMLETLLDGAVDDPQVNRDFLERALKNTRNLNALLSDLIEISRIESGDMKMSFRYFDAVGLIEAVVSEMAPMAERRGVKIDAVAGQPSAEAYGDRERLKQVLVNLIDNAVKHAGAPGVVRVMASGSPEGVRLSVEDEGVGIPPEALGRIFERFYRVDKERSRDAGGTGLGLAIVKHIVEAHGGRVDVVSAPGRGSTFSFLLKAAP